MFGELAFVIVIVVVVVVVVWFTWSSRVVLATRDTKKRDKSQLYANHAQPSH